MINFNPDRKIAVLYTCGVCNLNCRYCGIDKNPILKKIDKALEDSFDGDYYFDRIKAYFPKKHMLQEVQTWGGEPFLKMERIYPLLRKLINYYPYFHKLFSSTNFSFPTWTDQFFGLMDCLGEFPYRNFYYTLQLSIDGPEYINDANRGKGTTQKCLNNFDKFVEQLKNGRLPGNIHLTIVNKGTLDMDNINYLYQNKQAIIDYYQFLEENYISKINNEKIPNVTFWPAIPNTAVPSPVTKENGIRFAELIRKCRQIEEENPTKNYFKYYNKIAPYSQHTCQNCLTYRYGLNNCGSGNDMVGFLPDNMVSSCHEGFTELVEDYKKLAADRNTEIASINFDRFISQDNNFMCLSDDQYIQHEQKMKLFNQEGSSARLVVTTAMIMALAMSEEIEPIFLKEENALKAALFVQARTAYCIKDSYHRTGSFATSPVGEYKLLLNGAMELLQDDDEGDELKIPC